MNGGTEKKLGRKDLAKKNTGMVRKTAKLHMCKRHIFKKNLKKLGIFRIPISKRGIISKQDYP